MDLYQPDFSETYRELDGVSLRIHGFGPRQGAPAKTAVVFFFGGGWTDGTPAQFFAHCIGLAARGATCFAAEYRVKGRHGTTPFESVADAKAAIRWLRRNAERLGFSPERVVAGGGSAGGHLAACAALVPWEEAGADTGVSCVPNAVLLFNAVLDATAAPVAVAALGARARELSPLHYVRPDAPPAILFHGSADTVVPPAQAQRFARLMREHGNPCSLTLFDGLAHGFFNLGRTPDVFPDTMNLAAAFLTELGLLSSPYAAVAAEAQEDDGRGRAPVTASRLVANLRAGRAQTVVAYGTSLTAGGAWVGQCQAEFERRFPGLCRMVNSGEGGMWSGWGVVNLEERVLAHRPDTVLIEFGTNDAFAPYGCSVEQARANLQDMLWALHMELPDSEIILQVMNPPIAEHALRRPHWSEYGCMYREMAAANGCLLLDHEPAWQAVLAQGEAAYRALVPDGIHPDANGCAQVITPGILRVLTAGAAAGSPQGE